MRVAVITSDGRDVVKAHATRDPLFGTAPEALLQGMRQLPNLEVHLVSCTRNPVQTTEKLAPNIFFHSLLVPKIGWMRTGFAGCILAVRKKLQQIRPDIVHGQGTEEYCSISAALSSFPNVLTIHGNMRLIAEVNRSKPFSFLWLAARLEGFTVPKSDGVVCITRYTQQAMAPLARRTWLLPNAVDSAFFDVRSQPPADKPPKILCVGAICPRKNQNAFIRSLDPLAKKHRFDLVFFGGVSRGGAYDEEFLALVKDRSWCSYPGLADREALRKQLQDASLLVLPSIEDNCPMAVLEAMAAGVPVIAAKVGGVPDLVEEGITGLFLDPHDPESMRSAVEKVLTNPAEARQRAERAKAEALRRFHPKVVAEGHRRIYEDVLAGKDKRRKSTS